MGLFRRRGKKRRRGKFGKPTNKNLQEVLKVGIVEVRKESAQK